MKGFVCVALGFVIFGAVFSEISDNGEKRRNRRLATEYNIGTGADHIKPDYVLIPSIASPIRLNEQETESYDFSISKGGPFEAILKEVSIKTDNTVTYPEVETEVGKLVYLKFNTINKNNKPEGDMQCIGSTRGTNKRTIFFNCFAKFDSNFEGTIDLGEADIIHDSSVGTKNEIKTGKAYICSNDPEATTTVPKDTCAAQLVEIESEIKERERSKGMNKGGQIATPIVLVLALLGAVGFAFLKRKVDEDPKPEVEVNGDESNNQQAQVKANELQRSDADNYVDSKQPLKNFKKGKTTAF